MRAGGNVHVPCLPGAHLCGGGRGLPAPRAADPPSLLPARVHPPGSQGARGQVTREAGDHETQASQGSQPEPWRSAAGPHPPSPLLLPSTNACVHFLCPAVCQEAGAVSKALLPWSVVHRRRERANISMHVSGVSDSLRPHGLQPPGSSVHGVLQVRTLEWVATPSSRGPSRPRDRTQVSRTAGGFFTV